MKNERGEGAAQKVHGVEELEDKKVAGAPMQCGCPGSMMRDFGNKDKSKSSDITTQSALRQWPIQLHLLNPEAPYFKGADLVVSADCAPFAYPNFHNKFLKGKILAMFCPKLDSNQDVYIEKLAHIFKTADIKSIAVVHMEVPCCGGVGHIVEEALKQSGKNIVIKDYTISVEGEII